MRVLLTLLVLLLPSLAGAAEIMVKVSLNGHDSPPGTRIFVHEKGKPEKEVADGMPGLAFQVPGGEWDVRAVTPGGPLGPLSGWVSVNLEPQEKRTMKIEIVQPIGFLKVNVTSNGQPLENGEAHLLPYGVKKEHEGEGLLPGDAQMLPVGKYTVLARWDSQGGTVLRWFDEVEVKPDETTVIESELVPSGLLTVDMSGLPADALVRVGILRPRELDPVSEIELLTPTRLPVGVYHLRVERHWPVPRKVFWQRDVELKAGDDKLVMLKAP